MGAGCCSSKSVALASCLGLKTKTHGQRKHPYIKESTVDHSNDDSFRNAESNLID